MKLYKFSPAFDHRLNRQSRNLLIWCIPIFCISAIWVLGNPNILEKTEIISFDTLKYKNLVFKEDQNKFFAPMVKLFDRATNLYAIPFSAILIAYVLLYLIWFIFGNLLGGLLGCICSCCKVKLKSK